MGSQVQSYLGPVATPNSIEFNKLDVSEKGKIQDKDGAPQVEFHTMLQNSNADMIRERQAKRTGDLSSAKTDEEFRNMLSEKANPKRAPKNTLGKDDFMKLFIAQMQSQDPLNPQDSSQMAAQMAQFNGLEQMMNVNKTLETMLQSQTTDRAVGMVNYVGKEVDIGTGLLKWDKNKLTKTTFEVEQPLANAFVEVRDSAGHVISQKDLGNLMPGEHNLKWDGKLKDGTNAASGIYHFSLVGKSIEGQEVPIPIKSKVKITGIDLKTPGGAFFTELGKLDVKDVASVGLQGFEDVKPVLAAIGAAAENSKNPEADLNQAPQLNPDLPKDENSGGIVDQLENVENSLQNAKDNSQEEPSPNIPGPELAIADPTRADGNLENLNIPVTLSGRSVEK